MVLVISMVPLLILVGMFRACGQTQIVMHVLYWPHQATTDWMEERITRSLFVQGLAELQENQSGSYRGEQPSTVILANAGYMGQGNVEAHQQ